MSTYTNPECRFILQVVSMPDGFSIERFDSADTVNRDILFKSLSLSMVDKVFFEIIDQLNNHTDKAFEIIAATSASDTNIYKLVKRIEYVCLKMPTWRKLL